MAQQDEMMTRDLGTLGEDGPQAVQFETPSARDAGQQTAERQRPSYSPVAQPGMNEDIWYHTVDSRREAQQQGRRRTRGMIGRFHEPQKVVIDERGRRGRRG